MKKVYIVTGAAGFIGYYTSRALLEAGNTVIGADSVNTYYSPVLKEMRLGKLESLSRESGAEFLFYQGDIADRGFVEQLLSRHPCDCFIHLAAQAGVRYSIDNPRAYGSSNLDGFLNVLEGVRHYKVPHLIFASSSSVYGLNRKVPFSERDFTEHPVSLYAATKKANEVMAHSYSAVYGIPVTGVRFFTVYGPLGRPDMAYFKFAESIMQDRPIQIYNNGDLLRDFTYIDDVVKALLLIAGRPAKPFDGFDPENPLPDRSSVPYRIYNIGNAHPEKLMDFIGILEAQLEKTARKEFLPMQAGDVYITSADTSALESDFGWKPSTSLETGLRQFTDWYKKERIWQLSL
ncbi:MAG: GDP-mannose 4,6-dehydratase [Spirochaetaceae bacterium]|jgi:UDP-glucuronate 4-epimerase|nr:GDP-mannose 4,6-dehydratase [Spirochaetaceae bacterium]